MKPITQLTRETLASISTLPRQPQTPLPQSPGARQKGNVKNPCETDWQRKWLGLDVVHPDIQIAADAAEMFCGRWFKNNTKDSLLVLVGNFGCGKTHIAKAMLRFCRLAAFTALEKGHGGSECVPCSCYISWPEAAASFNEKQFGIMEDAFGSDLLILDDIGAENDPWKICSDKLCQILSRRERRFTVVTTNVAPANWTEKFDGRINDRLMRNSVIADMSHVSSYSML